MKSDPPDWLPASLVPAFMGMAFRAGAAGPETLPALDWKRAVAAMLKDAEVSPAEVWAAMSELPVLWIFPVPRAVYWNAIRNRGMRAWDELHDLCLGIAHHNGLRIPVYDKMGTVRYFQDGFVDASGAIAESEIRRMALERFASISRYHNGDGTPYFLE